MFLLRRRDFHGKMVGPCPTILSLNPVAIGYVETSMDFDDPQTKQAVDKQAEQVGQDHQSDNNNNPGGGEGSGGEQREGEVPPCRQKKQPMVR